MGISPEVSVGSEGSEGSDVSAGSAGSGRCAGGSPAICLSVAAVGTPA